jgi:hypothetical protein
MDSRVFFLLFFFCFDLFRLVRYRYAFDCKWQVCIHFLLLFAIFFKYILIILFTLIIFFSTVSFFLFSFFL